MYHTESGKRSMEGNMPLVSVIMPCYNHGAYVGNAIESILNQTYPNIELIVADNGCTDNSFEVISQYRDRIKILRLEKNDRRLCGEMLYESATGEYIANATADDAWMPEKIELQMEAFLSIPDLQVCFTWALEADENLQVCLKQKNVFLGVKNRSRGEWLDFFFHRGNCLCFPSALYRADVTEYFRGIKRGYAQLSDFYQWICAVQLGEIHVVERPMVLFRWHVDGNSANDSAPSMGNAIRAALEYSDIALRIVEDTGDELLKEAFGREFVNRNAQTHQELLCERFFLLKHRAEEAPVFSSAMFAFYYNHYLEIERMLLSQYNFSFDHYRELAEHSGLAYTNVMLDLAKVQNKIQEDSLCAYRQMALKLRGECCPEGMDKEKARIIYTWMPETEQEELRKLHEVCHSILNWISRHGMALDVLYFEFIKLIVRAYQLMDDMRIQLKLLGILQEDEAFDLFGQLVQFAETDKINLLEAVIPYIQMVSGQLDEIIN